MNQNLIFAIVWDDMNSGWIGVGKHEIQKVSEAYAPETEENNIFVDYGRSIDFI